MANLSLLKHLVFISWFLNVNSTAVSGSMCHVSNILSRASSCNLVDVTHVHVYMRTK